MKRVCNVTILPVVFGVIAAFLIGAHLNSSPFRANSESEGLNAFTSKVAFQEKDEKEPKRRGLFARPIINFHKKLKPGKDALKSRYQLSDDDMRTISDLPGVCKSDLPGLGDKEPKHPSKAERRIWRADELASHKSAVEKIASDYALDINEMNPHAGAQVSHNVDIKNGEDPHLEVFSRDAFPSAEQCATCHKQIYDEWAVSSHAYAAVSPMFHRFENTINKLASGTIGYFCLRCHAPVATTMGLRRDQAIWDGPKVFREGVTCVACHRVKTPYSKVHGARRIEPGDVFDPVYGSGDGTGVEKVLKYQGYFKVKTDDKAKAPGQAIHRRAIKFEELSKSTFCVSCHQVAVQPGIKLEVVWDQYRASPAYREGISCQDCHMGKVPGVAAGYSVGPAAVVSERVVTPDRKHSNHGFYGPGYSIAHPGIWPFNKEADRWKFNDWLEFDWRAGWGTDEFEDALPEGAEEGFPPAWQNIDDRYDAREIVELNLKKLEYKKDIRRQVMENGSKLDGPFFIKTPELGKPLNFYYCLTNISTGHNMPSGSLGAQPQVWMNVVLLDPLGRRIWETGHTDSNGDVCDIHSYDVQDRKLPLDKQLFNLQTKFLTTNVKGTDREMLLPVPVDADQLPFIRPEFRATTVINHPPTIRMEGHSLPATGSRNARFSVPKRLIQMPGTYRMSVRMRSRAEPIYFMRYCDSTPEMERMMNEWICDFHTYSVTFDVH